MVDCFSVHGHEVVVEKSKKKSDGHTGNKLGMERKKRKDALMRERDRTMARRRNMERRAEIQRKTRLSQGRKAGAAVGRDPLGGWCPT